MKKGFSLVEIMVVIVIVGILTVVGVPKLFGVIAKAKASEVPIAASTYVNLQNAYLHENNGIGSWKNIGYGAPGNGKTENFEYGGCINGTIPFDRMEPDMPGWQASSRTRLNMCKTGSAWVVIIDPAGEREIAYRKMVSSAECVSLTSDWNVGSAVKGMCEATGELHNIPDEEPPEETPEPSDDSEEPVGSVAENTTASSSSTAQSSSQQGDCEALAKSVKNDNGNKYGWVCISECGMFAPPGKAKNAGFTGNYEKKKNSSTCAKTTPQDQGNSGNNGNQGGNSSSSVAQSAGGTNSTGTANSAGSGTGGGTGGTGGGTGGGGTGGGSGGTSQAEETMSSAGTGELEVSSSSAYPGYEGHGEPHDYNSDIDFCTKYSGNTCVKWRPKSECSKKTGNGNKCVEW